MRAAISCGLKLTVDDFTVDSLCGFLEYMDKSLDESEQKKVGAKKLSALKGGLN